MDNCCPICAEDYYVKDDDISEYKSVIGSVNEDVSCEYICDNGNQCKHPKVEDDELCKMHVRQRIPIKCGSCSKACCKICYRKFFLQQAEEPMCMFTECKNGFDVEFLLGFDENKVQRFSRSFIWGPWKEHRENILLDQIMARMPEYQPLASAQAKLVRATALRKKIDQRIVDLRTVLLPYKRKVSAYKEIKDVERDEFKDQAELDRLEPEVEKYETRIDKLKSSATKVRQQIDRERFMIDNGHYPGTQQEVEDAKEAKKAETFVHRGKCPRDNCHGFVEDKWLCGMCGAKICSICMCEKILKDEDGKKIKHECDENEVETIKALRQLKENGEVKPCPACRTLIYRVEGCNQMWCTNGDCHQFFDWHSGKIIENPRWVHNPHHDEWVRENGGDLGIAEFEQVAAGMGICGLQSSQIYDLDNLDREQMDLLAEILRDSNEIRDERAQAVDPLEKRLRNTSVQFLKGEKSRKDLKVMVQRHYKASKKLQMANMRRDMYADTVQQILRVAIKDIGEAMTPDKSAEIVSRTIKAVESLTDYTLKSMKVIGQIFNSKAPHLSETAFKKERARLVHRPKIILKLIERSREYLEEQNGWEHYGDWHFNSYHRYKWDSNKEVIFCLTNTVNHYRFLVFLRDNPDWESTTKEITKAIEKTEKIGYQPKFKPRQRAHQSYQYIDLPIQEYRTKEEYRNKYHGKCLYTQFEWTDEFDQATPCQAETRNTVGGSKFIMCETHRNGWQVSHRADRSFDSLLPRNQQPQPAQQPNDLDTNLAAAIQASLEISGN